jgi:hypothetical protein
MINEQTFAMIIARLDRIEAKVDKLMSFRSYVMGIGAVFGMIGSYFVSLIKGY